MFYKYKVGWYDNYKDKETDDEGIVCADNYSSAAERVVCDYGVDSVYELSLKEIAVNDSDSYCLSKEEIDYTFRED